jgi:hypothetical protein
MIDKLKQTFIGIPLSLKEKLLNLPDITPNPKGKGRAFFRRSCQKIIIMSIKKIKC